MLEVFQVKKKEQTEACSFLDLKFSFTEVSCVLTYVCACMYV